MPISAENKSKTVSFTFLFLRIPPITCLTYGTDIIIAFMSGFPEEIEKLEVSFILILIEKGAFWASIHFVSMKGIFNYISKLFFTNQTTCSQVGVSIQSGGIKNAFRLFHQASPENGSKY